ncbi:MAG: RMD1 family protein [Polyangiaceae bacterium]
MTPSAVDSVAVRAECIAERVDLRALQGTRLSSDAVELALEGGARAIVFRYGCFVTFGCDDAERTRVRSALESHLSGPLEAPEREDALLQIRPGQPEGVNREGICVERVDALRAEIVASVLSQSVALARYETIVTQAFRQVEPLATKLRTGKGLHRSSELVEQLGASLLVEHAMVGLIAVDEKPEVLWEHPELERLHEQLSEEYELRDRHRAVQRKLELIRRTAQTLLDLTQARRSLHVEWYILAVIVIEMGMMAYEISVHMR